jgi:hypothetical protein
MYVPIVHEIIINPFLVLIVPIPVIVVHNRMQKVKIRKNKLVIKTTLSNGQNSCPRPLDFRVLHLASNSALNLNFPRLFPDISRIYLQTSLT